MARFARNAVVIAAGFAAVSVIGYTAGLLDLAGYRGPAMLCIALGVLLTALVAVEVR